MDIGENFLDEEEDIREYYVQASPKIYEKYFENTIPLNDNNFDDLITDIKNDKKEIIGRIFKKKDHSVGYEEYFIWEEIHIISQLSRNITFLFPPGEGKKIDKLIGYRFYEESPEKTNNYFTLVLKDKRKYEILEKNSQINNAFGKSFKNENLKCFNIIYKIIKNKFEDDITYNYPNTSIELLGFYYSVMCEEHKNIKFIDPFYPLINDRSTMKEVINKEDICDDMIFVEPILFNRHISVLYFSFKNDLRRNILVDPSLLHVKSITKDRVIFPKEMRNILKIYPEYSCQNGPSSSIWFIGQILFVSNFKNTKLISDDFTFQYINLLRIIENINNLIKIDSAPIIYSSKLNIKSDSINISDDERCKISHRITFATFLDVFGTLNSCGIHIKLNLSLKKIKKNFEKIQNFICTVKLNKEHYDFLGKKTDISKNIIDKMKKEFNDLKMDYDIYVNTYLNAQKDNYEAFKLTHDFIYMLEVKLKDFNSYIKCNIYDREDIINIYLNKSDVFSLFTN